MLRVSLHPQLCLQEPYNLILIKDVYHYCRIYLNKATVQYYIYIIRIRIKKIKETVHSQSLEEVRQGYEVRSNSHDQTANTNQPGTMELGTKVTHEGYYQQVAWEGEEFKK